MDLINNEIHKLCAYRTMIKPKYYINTIQVPLVSLGSTVRATLTCSRYVRLRTLGTSLVVGGVVVALVVVVVGNVVVVVVDVVDVVGGCVCVVVVGVVVVGVVSICPVTKPMSNNYRSWRSVDRIIIFVGINFREFKKKWSLQE